MSGRSRPEGRLSTLRGAQGIGRGIGYSHMAHCVAIRSAVLQLIPSRCAFPRLGRRGRLPWPSGAASWFRAGLCSRALSLAPVWARGRWVVHGGRAAPGSPQAWPDPFRRPTPPQRHPSAHCVSHHHTPPCRQHIIQPHARNQPLGQTSGMLGASHPGSHPFVAIGGAQGKRFPPSLGHPAFAQIDALHMVGRLVRERRLLKLLRHAAVWSRHRQPASSSHQRRRGL